MSESPRPSPTPSRIRALRRRLLEWYREHRRDLPWRSTCDPYAIWVAEIMLQQTRVGTVIPYYRRFLERFPDVLSLADAPEDSVLAAWSGLGYYGRARSLRKAAREIVTSHGGRIPQDASTLRELPGIGRYTAGAIASQAFGRPEPVVDGNVRRVLARLTADPDPPRAGLWDLAARLVTGPAPGELNQALMELGALVCTPRAPSCASCPVRRSCLGASSGRPESFPPSRPSRPARTVEVGVALVRRGGRLLVERPRGGPFRGNWDLPAAAAHDGEDPARAVEEHLASRHGLIVRAESPVGRADHAILNRRLRLAAYPCRWSRGRTAGAADLRWIRPDEIDDVAVSGATRKVIALSEAPTAEGKSLRGPRAPAPTPAPAPAGTGSGRTSPRSGEPRRRPGRSRPNRPAAR